MNPEINWKVTTAPSVEPVTLVEAKAHIRVDTDDDDTLIGSLIVAARQWCEDYEGRAYITQTFTAKLDRFASKILLPRPVLQSITSIKYIDIAGDEQTLDSGVYAIDTYRQPGRVTLAYGQSWPTLRGDVNGVEIIYKTGYGDATTDVPDKTRSAILLLIGHLHENREMTTTLTIKTLPFAVQNLLNARTWT